MLDRIKQKLVSWLLKGVHIDRLEVGEHSVVVAGTGINMGATKIENVGAPDSDDDVPRRVFSDLTGRWSLAQAKDMALNKVMVGQGATNSPVEQDKPAGATKEFFVPVTYTDGTWGDSDQRPAAVLVMNESAWINFSVPHDFTSIIAAVIQVLPAANLAAADWEIHSAYAAVGEDGLTHSESDITSTYNVTDNQLFEVDISGILSSLAAGDNVGLCIKQVTMGYDMDVLGVRFKYS